MSESIDNGTYHGAKKEGDLNLPIPGGNVKSVVHNSAGTTKEFKLYSPYGTMSFINGETPTADSFLEKFYDYYGKKIEDFKFYELSDDAIEHIDFEKFNEFNCDTKDISPDTIIENFRSHLGQISKINLSEQKEIIFEEIKPDSKIIFELQHVLVITYNSIRVETVHSVHEVRRNRLLYYFFGEQLFDENIDLQIFVYDLYGEKITKVPETNKILSVPRIVRVEYPNGVIYTNGTYEDIRQVHGEKLVPFVKGKMLDQDMWKNKAENGTLFLPKTQNETCAVVDDDDDDDDEFLVNRSKCMGFTFNKESLKRPKRLCFSSKKEEKTDSMEKLKSFISSELKLNSNLFEITTETGQRVQSLDQVQDVIYIKKAKNYWKWDLKFYLMCISTLLALADFALDLNTIREYFEIGEKYFGIIMVVLISMNILVRQYFIIIEDIFKDHCLRLLYPILDIDKIIEDYERWKDGKINSRYYAFEEKDAIHLSELFLENIPSFFLGLYAMVLRGEINISILLSVVSSGIMLCINLIPVSAMRPDYLTYQNPGKSKIQLLEFFQTAIEFVSRAVILILFVYVTRPWGAWILFIVKSLAAFIMLIRNDSKVAKNLCKKIGSVIRNGIIGCVYGALTSFYIKVYAFIYPDEIINRCKQLLNMYYSYLVEYDKEMLFRIRIWMMIEAIIYAVFVIFNFEDIEDNDLRYKLAIIGFAGVILTWVIYLKDMIGIKKVMKFINNVSNVEKDETRA